MNTINTKLREKNSLTKLSILIFVLLIFIIVPPFIGGYWLHTLILFTINILLVQSFMLITTTGRWNFAHIVFMGLGGYTSALLGIQFFNLPFWVLLPLGGLVATLVGLVLSYPLLRTKGWYFFLASYAAGEAIRQAWIRFEFPFRAYWGISDIPRPEFPGVEFNSLNYYYLVLFFVFLCVFILYWLNKSRIGDTLRAISSNEDLCKSVGINTRGYSTLAFVVGCFFAGITGVLWAHYTRMVTPMDFAITFMFRVVAWAIVGGIHTFIGPIIGLLTMTVITEVFRDMLEWLPLIYGLFVIGILLFLPTGLESLPGRISPFLARIKLQFRRNR
ncbi:branched-chain amino acid ABC transporter permease [Chloroflexota bacterium]